jgi:anti-anti-sigma factor
MAQVERRNDVTVIHLDPAYEALDHSKFEAAQKLLLGHAETVEPPLVVLDLSQTAYMGSAFIEVMFRTWKRIAERDGKLVLSGVQPLCQEVLHTTRLDSVVQSYASIDDAVRGLRAS